MTLALAVVKRHFPVIIGAGGAVMIVLGVLILTGEFTILNTGSRTTCTWPPRQESGSRPRQTARRPGAGAVGRAAPGGGVNPAEPPAT